MQGEKMAPLHNPNTMKNPKLLTGACVAALAFCGATTAFSAPKKEASPSPSPSGSGLPTAATASSTSSTAKAPRATAFRGSVASVDASAKTFTIAGKTPRVVKVTDKTMVTKAGETATFTDMAADEKVTGSYWKQADGTYEAKLVKIGGPSDADKASSKKSKKADETAADSSSSPSPSPKK